MKTAFASSRQPFFQQLMFTGGLLGSILTVVLPVSLVKEEIANVCMLVLPKLEKVRGLFHVLKHLMEQTLQF